MADHFVVWESSQRRRAAEIQRRSEARQDVFRVPMSPGGRHHRRPPPRSERRLRSRSLHRSVARRQSPSPVRHRSPNRMSHRNVARRRSPSPVQASHRNVAGRSRRDQEGRTTVERRVESVVVVPSAATVSSRILAPGCSVSFHTYHLCSNLCRMICQNRRLSRFVRY